MATIYKLTKEHAETAPWWKIYLDTKAFVDDFNTYMRETASD